jgi:hypothetical protein
VVAEMNDCQLKIVKLQVRDGAVHVSEGDMFVSRSAWSTNPMRSPR